MVDLSLIPIDELIEEIEKRCTEFICAYNPNNFQTHKESHFYYGKGSWYQACALGSQLNNNILNNWNGELRVLQRINEDEKD